MSQNPTSGINRRKFLATSAAASAALAFSRTTRGQAKEAKVDDVNVVLIGIGVQGSVLLTENMLKMKGLLPDFSTSSTDTVLIGMQDESLRPMAMESAMAMRAAGVKTDLVIEAKKMKWLFKHADRTRAPYVVLFAPREVEEGVVRVKCMADGEQEDVKIGELAAHLAAKMGAA